MGWGCSFVGGGQEKEGQTDFGCMKEPQASHLAPIKSVMFFAPIYKTDGPKIKLQFFTIRAVRS